MSDADRTSNECFTPEYISEVVKELESRGWRPDSRGDPECCDEASAAGAQIIEHLQARLSAEPKPQPSKTSAMTTSNTMAMLPNDKHPGPGCSCADCLRAYPEQPTSKEEFTRWSKVRREISCLEIEHEKALERIDALTLELENTNANLVKVIRRADEPSEDRAELIRRLENISSYDDSDAWDVICDAIKELRRPEPPEPTHFAFLIQRPRDSEPWATIFTDRARAEGYEHRASPVVGLSLTKSSPLSGEVSR